MEERLSVNFTRKDLRKLLIPLVIEQLLAITVGLADSLMVAQVGESPAAFFTSMVTWSPSASFRAS